MSWDCYISSNYGQSAWNNQTSHSQQLKNGSFERIQNPLSTTYCIPGKAIFWNNLIFERRKKSGAPQTISDSIEIYFCFSAEYFSWRVIVDVFFEIPEVTILEILCLVISEESKAHLVLWNGHYNCPHHPLGPNTGWNHEIVDCWPLRSCLSDILSVVDSQLWKMSTKFFKQSTRFALKFDFWVSSHLAFPIEIHENNMEPLSKHRWVFFPGFWIHFPEIEYLSRNLQAVDNIGVRFTHT